MIIFGGTDGVVPFLVKKILDGVFAAQDKNLLYLLPLLILGFALVRGVADFFQEFLMARLGHKIVRDLRRDLNSHLLSQDPLYFVTASSAELSTRVTNDTLFVKGLLTDSIASLIRDSIRITALVGAAIYLDPTLALLAVVVFPIAIFPVLKIGKKMRRLGKRGQASVGVISSLLQASMIGGKVVRIFGREKFEEERFNHENENLYRTLVKSDRSKALTGPINEILASFAISGVLLYGGSTVIAGVRTQGEFIAFLLSIFLLYDPFKRLSKVHATMQNSLGAAERLFDIIDAHPTIVEHVNPQPLNESSEIEYRDVSVMYPNSPQAALKNISLKIPERGYVAFVGLSGAGKSTAIDCIPRFIDATEGEVFVSGVNVKEVSLSALRKKIALVSQHTFLFNSSVKENIRYGRLEATDDEIIEAAKKAGAYEFISQLSNGFDTVIGESGSSLSGGERQRIALARALVKNAPILILDEATASLDNRSEREIQDTLDSVMKEKTSIVIAHRLSTVMNADCIYVFQDGEIRERGTHESLLKEHGLYEQLYALQFKQE